MTHVRGFSDSVDADLVERVESLVSQLRGGPVRCRLEGPAYRGDYSRVFRGECEAIGSLAVKLCTTGPDGAPDAETAQRQFNTFERVASAMGDGLLRVPRPYAVDPPSGLLLVEWVEGASMTANLCSSRCSVDQARSMASQAARWLRHFHDSHQLPPRPLDVEHKLQGVAEFESSPLSSESLVRQALAQLRAKATAAAEHPLACSWLHGDFKTDNLVLTDRTVVGIDVHGRYENVAVYDIAPFLNHLELLAWRPAAWRWTLHVRRLQQAFLAAYFGSEAVPSLALWWVRIYLLIAVWDMMTRRQGIGRHKARLVHYCFKRSLKRLCTEIARL